MKTTLALLIEFLLYLAPLIYDIINVIYDRARAPDSRGLISALVVSITNALVISGFNFIGTLFPMMNSVRYVFQPLLMSRLQPLLVQQSVRVEKILHSQWAKYKNRRK